MKKLIGTTALGVSLLIANPAFAYEVKSGDTMSEIARENSLSLSQLTTMNPQVKNVNLIYVGQNINVDRAVKLSEVSKPSNNYLKQAKVKKASYKTQTSVANNSELDLLARLVRAEAQSESYAGKVAVAEVVLNRVKSNQFPNSIQGVIYQNGQFSPVSNGSINKPADSESLAAAREALATSGSNVGGALFFYNPNTASSRWLDSRQTVTTIGNHSFKL